ncbi:hypothetical protein DXG01_011925 [Tephrocybe rancida]|nr:hypothetical protein DXG01_011925 [Tephrocybe rancida]
MTSRVQKGGPIFRPVAKSRARPEVTTDNNSIAAQHVVSPSLPPSLPAPSEALPFESTATRPLIPTVIPSTLIPVARIPPQNSSAPPPILSGRSTPAPPTIARATPIPAITRNPLPPSFASSSPAPTQRQDSSSAGPYPSLPNPQISSNSGTENVLPMTLNTQTIVKPQRTSTRKKATSTSDPSSVPDSQSVPDDLNTAPKPRKNSRTSSTARKTPAKRKKKASTSDAEGTDDEAPESTTAKRKRRASSTPRSRRSRGPSLPPFDPDADPGEEIDPTVVTMASLCNDTGQGRVSRKAAEILSNHAAWKTQNREKRARMKALMELKKYGREEEAEALEVSASTPVDKSPDEPEITSTASKEPVINDDTGSGFDYTQDLATSRFNVQVRIGPNGETIIDEESLVVDRVEAEDTTNYTHVVESDHTKFVNSGSYGKRYRGSRWSAEETELFFDALAQYGENYELIAYVLPGRDRKSCKNKFKAEDKKNPARINHCLNNNIPVDMETLSRMTGKDFSGPVPEIRVSTPPPIVEPGEATSTEQAIAPPEPVRKKSMKKKSHDDGAMIVGDADSFVPFPASP